jgi:tryptophan synthase alpha chain
VQHKIAESAAPLIERMRRHTKLPLAMGFGVSTPEHVAELAGKVEAVVVGSAIVKQIEKDSSQLEDLMRALTRPLARGAIS